MRKSNKSKLVSKKAWWRYSQSNTGKKKHLQQICNKSNSDTFNNLISNERGSLVVAEEDGKILGMASISFNLALRYNGEYCQLEELVVDQDARGKNVGGLLIEETLRLAKNRGCKEFGLYLLESTKHNQPFYEKYGFIKIGEEMRQSL